MDGVRVFVFGCLCVPVFVRVCLCISPSCPCLARAHTLHFFQLLPGLRFGDWGRDLRTEQVVASTKLTYFFQLLPGLRFGDWGRDLRAGQVVASRRKDLP